MPRALELWIAGGVVFASTIGLAAAGEGTITVAPSSVAVQMDKAGEISLAVVPPGKKTQCPNGRVLIANDEHGPAWGPTRRLDDIVSGIDLVTNAVTPALFNEPPNPLDYQHNWSSDKNMVSLPNGDVIYQAPSFSKRPITASGADSTWFNSTFHFDGNTKQPDFGPGARSVLTIWRSVDCGATFQYVGEADPAAFGHQGECAYPQPPVRQATSGAFRYSMGGTDGPWLGVDQTTGALILTHGCVGNFSMKTAPTLSKAGENPKCTTTPKAVEPEDKIAPSPTLATFFLSDCKVNKTYVLTSTNSGKDWTTKGVIDTNSWMWRAMAVPLPQNKLAVGWNGAVYLGTPSNRGALDFKPIPGPGIATSYDFGKVPEGAFGAWPTLLSRVPGAATKVFLMVPGTFTVDVTITGKNLMTHGYQVYVVDTATGAWSKPANVLNNIVPANRTTNNLIAHLTRVDTGEGPVLFYWYDVSADTKTATIRGRVYYSENVMTDFVISKKNGNDTSFSLPGPAGSYSYRHYKMAEGFRKISRAGVQAKTYEYFPTWVEPDNGGTAHFSRVTVTVPLLSLDKVKIDKATLILSKLPMLTLQSSSLKGVPPLSPEFRIFLEEHDRERGRP
jgi:hypothetical protein